MEKKITFQQIADELGVSKGLVSLAMRNKYGVSEDMRSKIVLKAIEMGYCFKQDPQKKIRNVTLLVKNMGILNEEFWRECILGIESECSARNMVFNIVGWMSLKDGNDVTMSLLNEKSQGIIVLNQCQSEIVEKIMMLHIPLVFVDMINPLSIPADQVMANNFAAGMQAVGYLLEKGHRKIILAGNIEYSFSFLQRYYGCVKAVKRAQRRGEEAEYFAVIDCEKPHLVDDVYQNDESDLVNDARLEEVLAANAGYTAIVCFNDSILRHAANILKKLSVRVPEDLSVVSIDNVRFSAEQGVTSVDIPKYELGVQAVRMLNERLESGRISSATLELNTVLIERTSVKEIKHEKD